MANEMSGKVVLITGATEGIGKAAAVELAKQGATVAIVGRSKDKSERVLAEVKAASGSDKVELFLADLSRLSDVRALATAFRAKHDRLDVLANNAGAVFNTYQISSDNFEMTFALNHLGYFLLTHLLLDLLKKTPGARVVSTSSDAHLSGKINLETIATRPNRDSGFGSYGDSKLANILFTRELKRKLEGSGVTANCFHPGVVRTGFGLNNKGIMAAGIKLLGPLFFRTPEKGAETLVWLASSPEAASFNGEYFHDKKVSRISKRAQDDAMAGQLWQLSEKLVGIA